MRKYDFVSVHAQSSRPANPGCRLTGLQLRTESSTQERLCVVRLVGPTADRCVLYQKPADVLAEGCAWLAGGNVVEMFISSCRCKPQAGGRFRLCFLSIAFLLSASRPPFWW